MWPDGHESRFDTEWLLRRSFTKDTLSRRKEEYDRPDRILWDKVRITKY